MAAVDKVCSMWWWVNGMTVNLEISLWYLCVSKLPLIKMHQGLLSRACGCLNHNHIATIGLSVHNIDISKLLTHTTPYMLCDIWPVQWKPGFMGENALLQRAGHYQKRVFAHSDRLQHQRHSGQDPTDNDRHALRHFLTVCAEILWLCNCCIGLAGEEAGCWSPGLLFRGLQASWLHCRILWKRHWGQLIVV